MVKTIEEKPPEQVRRRPSPRSGLATRAFQPEEELPLQTRGQEAYGRHMTPPGTLPPLPAASLSGPVRLPEGRSPTGPLVADAECFMTNSGRPFRRFCGILPHSRETTSRGIGKPASDSGRTIHLLYIAG